MSYANFHTHTSFSDGAINPDELVTKVLQEGDLVGTHLFVKVFSDYFFGRIDQAAYRFRLPASRRLRHDRNPAAVQQHRRLTAQEALCVGTLLSPAGHPHGVLQDETMFGDRAGAEFQAA